MYGMKGILLGTKLYSKMFVWNKSLMFIGKYVTKLIAGTWSRADDFINIPMRMAIYPIIYSTILNEVFMFNDESTVQTAAFKLWCAKLV